MEMGGGRGGYKKYSTPGGRALKFYASVRIEFQQIKNLKGKSVDELTHEVEELIEATDVRIRVVKNKVAPPFRQAVVRVRFGRGFDNAYTALKILAGHKKIMMGAGGYFFFHNLPDLAEGMDRLATGTHRPYIRGEASLFDRLDTDPVWREAFIQAARDVLNEDPDAAAVPVNPDDLAELEDEASEDLEI